MKRNFAIFLLLACAAGFAFGLLHLFQLRFAAGDVYPEYSSLRADPLGTMAFCESLQRMPGLSVRRDFNSGNELPEGKDTVYLHLAARTLAWTSLPDDLTREIEHFLAAGGRLAVTFFPETSQPRRPFFEEDLDNNPRPEGRRPKEPRNPKPERTPPQPPASQPSDFGPRTSFGLRTSDFGLVHRQPDVAGNAEKRKKSASSKKDRQLHPTRLQTWWGLDFAFVPLDQGEADSYQPAPVVNKTDLPLPATLAWHSAAVFTNLAKSWRTIYARGTNPVVVERRFGPGTVILAADSYFLSNEALRKDRHPDLLAWLVGPSRNVVFDEAHFGIVDTSGVASLIRKYRLHGLTLALLLLAGLFLWQNAVSFVPPTPEERAPDYVPGKEAAAGFVNLLRRNVSPRDVLQTCFAEWKKSFSRGAGPSAARIIQAQAILDAESALPQRQRDSIRAYQQICDILKPTHSFNPNLIPQAAPNAEGPERRHPAGLGRPDGASRQDGGAPASKSQDNQTKPL
jgi:hypothetical protein